LYRISFFRNLILPIAALKTAFGEHLVSRPKSRFTTYWISV